MKSQPVTYQAIIDTADARRAKAALKLLLRFGQIDGEHHKTWVIDQAIRQLAGPHYKTLVQIMCDGEDGPETYGWDEGTPP